MNRGTILLSLTVLLGSLATGGDQSGIPNPPLLGLALVLGVWGAARWRRGLGAGA